MNDTPSPVPPRPTHNVITVTIEQLSRWRWAAWISERKLLGSTLYATSEARLRRKVDRHIAAERQREAWRRQHPPEHYSLTEEAR